MSARALSIGSARGLLAGLFNQACEGSIRLLQSGCFNQAASMRLPQSGCDGSVRRAVQSGCFNRAAMGLFAGLFNQAWEGRSGCFKWVRKGSAFWGVGRPGCCWKREVVERGRLLEEGGCFNLRIGQRGGCFNPPACRQPWLRCLPCCLPHPPSRGRRCCCGCWQPSCLRM